jgi:subtilisin family serine protease
VFNHGIVWVNGAGNSARGHWEGTFNDSDGDGWHEFPSEGGELAQTIYVNPAWSYFQDGVTLLLSWNGSWNNETQDYDIYIFDESRKAVARSIDPQMGLNGHKSFEAIEWMPASRGRYSIVIRNCNATKPVHFELYLWPWGTTPSCNVEKSSLCADATARGVIAAGAVDQGNNIEDYSSRGATNDGRIKPDFVAPVGYDTCAYSGPFSGTSASSPHIAGELALLLSWIKETQPQQNGTAYELIKPYLDDIANTIEPDNQSGYGLFPECYNSS